MPRRFHDAEELLPPANLLRRLLAMIYDGLICIAVLLVTTWIYTMVAAWFIGFDRYEEMMEAGKASADPMLSFTLFLVLYLFFAYFWTRTGQTLGMQVWRIRIENLDGTSVSWTQSLKRYLAGWVSLCLAGIGHWWMIWDSDRQTWSDKFSGSVVVRVPNEKKT